MKFIFIIKKIGIKIEFIAITSLLVINILSCCSLTSGTTDAISENVPETSSSDKTPAETTVKAAETLLNHKHIEYRNTQYGFIFSLPDSWENYSIMIGQWEGTPLGSEDVTEIGPVISIRNPKWTKKNHIRMYQ